MLKGQQTTSHTNFAFFTTGNRNGSKSYFASPGHFLKVKVKSQVIWFGHNTEVLSPSTNQVAILFA